MCEKYNDCNITLRLQFILFGLSIDTRHIDNKQRLLAENKIKSIDTVVLHDARRASVEV